MIKYDSVLITPAAGEVMAAAPLVSGLDGTPRKLTGVYTEPTGDIRVRVYIDQERIADIDSEAFDGGGFMALDNDLGAGKQVKVGLWTVAGSTAQDVTLRWEE